MAKRQPIATSPPAPSEFRAAPQEAMKKLMTTMRQNILSAAGVADRGARRNSPGRSRSDIAKELADRARSVRLTVPTLHEGQVL